MSDRDEGAREEIQGRIEKQTKRINALLITVLQLVNFYFASQAVVFTALTGDSTSLVCRDLWFPLVISLVPALLNITALSVIGWNLVNATADRFKLNRELSTYRQSNTPQPLQSNTPQPLLPTRTAASETRTAAPGTRNLPTTATSMPPALPPQAPAAAVATRTVAPWTRTLSLPAPATQMPALSMTPIPMPPALQPTAPAAAVPTRTATPGTTGDISFKIRHTICLCACMFVLAIFTIVLAVGSWWMLCREQNIVTHHDDDAKCVKLLCDGGNCIKLCRKSKG